MKKLIELLVLSVFAIVLTGCGKGLSGTYKHEKSGKIVEFASSTDFKMHYPNGAVIDGTYRKTKAGYELSAAGGSVFAVTKKEGKSLQIDDALYLKQKEKSIYIYYIVVFSVLYWVLGVWFVVSRIENCKWMGIKICSKKNKILSNLLILIFMPIFGILIILFIIYCIFTSQFPIDVT